MMRFIKEAKYKDSNEIAKIISISNKDVAEKFGINKKNNPKHPSFYTNDWVLSDLKRGEKYFLFMFDCEYIGCVAFEQKDSNKGYLNRLAVLPEYRKQGVGEALVKHIFMYAQLQGLKEISIGIIAEHENLKNWYKKLGFVENGIKEFSHLPFDVMFMKYYLSKKS